MYEGCVAFLAVLLIFTMRSGNIILNHSLIAQVRMSQSNVKFTSKQPQSAEQDLQTNNSTNPQNRSVDQTQNTLWLWAMETFCSYFLYIYSINAKQLNGLCWVFFICIFFYLSGLNVI